MAAARAHRLPAAFEGRAALALKDVEQRGIVKRDRLAKGMRIRRAYLHTLHTKPGDRTRVPRSISIGIVACFGVRPVVRLRTARRQERATLASVGLSAAFRFRAGAASTIAARGAGPHRRPSRLQSQTARRCDDAPGAHPSGAVPATAGTVPPRRS